VMSGLEAADPDGRGAIFTRHEVVNFILDLAGYTANKPLHRMRLLEPSVGNGDFLTPAIERLFAAYDREIRTGKRDVVGDLGDAIRAVEVHRSSFTKTRKIVADALRRHDVAEPDIGTICDLWLQQGDFLLIPQDISFTHVVGNPPYIRQELIPSDLMMEYRRRFSTIYDRADIYIPFIEHSLSMLAPGGALAFICADRWMKNRYGGPLRRFIADGFSLKIFVDMVDTNAFLSNVVAYPAIIVVAREKSSMTRIAYRPAIDTDALQALATALTAPKMGKAKGVSEVSGVAKGAAPWMLDGADKLLLVRRLEEHYPTLEESGCKVGIGVATGADQVFIGRYDHLDVEPDRKLPLVMTGDIVSGAVEWRGFGVINPFGPDGKLVALTEYPKLAAYFENHSKMIKARHVSKKNPAGWYRTIDRIYPEIARVQKLLIPDIKGSAHIVYEGGQLYPHHNLYYIISKEWDLHALQSVLLSDVTRMFIALYSTKMRGGYLRFQAQYLRRLRLPRWSDVPKALRSDLTEAGKTRRLAFCNHATFELYKLSKSERGAVSEVNGLNDVA